MSSDDRQPNDVIQDVISFLKKERDLYGEFSTSGFLNPENPESGTKDTTGKKAGSHSEQGKPETPDTDDEQPDIYSRIERCNTLEELKELCGQAEELKTDLEGTNLVFGVGNPEADLMLIGEAPGEEEDRQGEPFVGAAGQLLNKILGAIDFKRNDVYIANILKHRPPNNRNPKPEERQRSLPFLLRQIDLISPKLILCLGKVAAQTLLDSDESLGRMRGKFHPFRENYELLATYHPAALLRHEKWKRPAWEDVQMIRKRYDELGCKP